MSNASSFEDLAKSIKPGPNPADEGGWQQGVLDATGLSGLPPSYRAYAQHLGGVGEWVVRTEQGDLPHFLEIYVRPPLFADTRELLRSILDMAAEEGQAELAAESGGLIPFGTDTDRIFFCWDPARVDDRGEPAIVMLDNNAELVVKPIAKDLFGLLEGYKPRG